MRRAGRRGGRKSEARLRSLFAQARELGVSVIALAGDEPLVRPELLDLAGDYPDIQFVLSTDGSLIGGAALDRLESLRNVIPVLSLDGYAVETKERQGEGVHGRTILAMERMRERRIFFGASVTVTRRSFPLVTSRMFARDLVEQGCRLFIYVDYMPVEPGTEHLVPSQSQRNCGSLSMSVLRSEFPALFLASSNMEQRFGGSVAAGRAFVHVSAEGDLELLSLLATETPAPAAIAPAAAVDDEISEFVPGSLAA